MSVSRAPLRFSRSNDYCAPLFLLAPSFLETASKRDAPLMLYTQDLRKEAGLFWFPRVGHDDTSGFP